MVSNSDAQSDKEIQAKNAAAFGRASLVANISI